MKLKEMLLHSSRSSLIATLLIGQLLISFPEFAYFAVQSYGDGNLTFVRGAYLASICAAGGVLFSILMWATVVEPLRKKRANRFANSDANVEKGN